MLAMGCKKSRNATQKAEPTAPAEPTSFAASRVRETLAQFEVMYASMPAMDETQRTATLAAAKPSFSRFYSEKKDEDRRASKGAPDITSDENTGNGKGPDSTRVERKGHKGRGEDGDTKHSPESKDNAKGLSVATMCVALQALSLGRLAQHALSLTIKIVSIPDATKFHNFDKQMRSAGAAMVLGFYHLHQSAAQSISFTFDEFASSRVDCIRKGDRRSPETTGRHIILNVTFKPFVESAYVVTSGIQDMFEESKQTRRGCSLRKPGLPYRKWSGNFWVQRICVFR